MRQANRFTLVIFMTFFSAWFGVAQTSNSQRPQKRSEDAIQLDTDLVTVDVIATDDKGNYVRGLTARDFNLFEDNQPMKIDFFGTGTKIEERPISAVFALDVSDSIEASRGQLAEQQASAKQFMSLLDQYSEFAVLTFNQEIHVLQNFTHDQNRILAAFHKAGQVGGTTHIYDAVDRAITMLKKVPQVRGGRRVRRVVILITDGFDTSSTIPYREVIRRANIADVTVYSITIPNYQLLIGGKKQRYYNLLDLTELVPRTGGMDFSADSYDYSPIFKAIREELASSYTLAYYPPNSSRTDRKFHTITVKPIRPGINLRLSRQGYQVKPE